MNDTIYISKDDLIKFFKYMPDTDALWADPTNYEHAKKIIDTLPLTKEKYIEQATIYEILDNLSNEGKLDLELDDAYDLVDMLPSVRFIDSLDKDIVLREDIVAAFETMFEEQQIMVGSPDYDYIMKFIKGIPNAKLEV